MKSIALVLLLGLAVTQGWAAESEWLTDLDKAQAKAKAEKKMVLVDFTGSDWCPPCKVLHKNVLSSKEFLAFAKDNLVLVEIDFPHNKKQSDDLKKANRELKKKLDVEGYPTVIVFDSEGKRLSTKVGYDDETPKEYIAQLKKLSPSGTPATAPKVGNKAT